MNENNTSHFLYLNRDNQWLDFHRFGLELRKDGTLRLDSLPIICQIICRL